MGPKRDGATHRRNPRPEDHSPVISAADIFCMAIAAGLMLLEAHRGVVPALISFAGVLLGLVLTRTFYVSLTDHMQPSSAYMLLLGATILIIAIFSTIVTRRLKMHVTEIEAAIGATLGLGTALFLSYGFIEWLAIRYGIGTPLVKNSLLFWAMNEAAGFHEVAAFFHKLTGR